MIKVLVNGVGAIGKRVAYAVYLQSDMKLIGVSDAFSSGILKTNLESGFLKGVPLYASTKSFRKGLENNGFKVVGVLPDLLANKKLRPDVVIDCTPKGVDAGNKKLYDKYGVKSIFQGGATSSISDISFNSRANYSACLGKNSLRVVSCNTTGLLRSIVPLHEKYSSRHVGVSLVRRAVDPWNSKTGPINSIVPVMSVPSHHGPDFQTVRSDINIVTQAVLVPTTLMHVHMVHLETERPAKLNEVLKIFERESRIKLLDGGFYPSTSEVMERAKDTGSPRGDNPELIIWKETINVLGNDVYWIHAVHSESIVVPENIDAIRALMGVEKDFEKSVALTNKNLGL